MKSLHLPTHFHWPDRHVAGTQLHQLLHSDRFWGIVAVVILLLLVALMGYIGIRYGSHTGGMPPYYLYH